MEKKKIFIASGNELIEERLKFKNFLHDNKLEPIVWENIDQSISENRFQDRINHVQLSKSDVVVFMIGERLGKYTQEELNYVLNELDLKEVKVYIYFFKIKDMNLVDKKELFKILSLQDMLEKEGKSYKEVKDYTELENHFFKQIKYFETNNTNIIKTLSLTEKKEYKIELKYHMKIPRRDPNFVGREKEIKKIIESLNSGVITAITAIRANGGVGKSSLAIEVCHQIVDNWRGANRYKDKVLFTDGILWIKLEKEHTINDIIEQQIEKQFGVDFGDKNYLTLLDKYLSEKDILVVVDSAEQNIPLTHELINEVFRRYPVLITSRVPFSGVIEINLDSLDREKSIELFQKYYKEELNDKEKEEVGDFCMDTLGGLPLSIKIVASHLERYKFKSLQDLKDNILELSDPTDSYGKNVKAVFEISYSVLTPKAQKVFAIASIYNYPFEDKHLLEIVKKDSETTSISKEIEELIDISFLEITKDGLFSYHPLVREYAKTKFKTFSNSKAIVEAFIEYWVSIIGSVDLSRYLDLYSDIAREAKESENFDRFFTVVKGVQDYLHKEGFYTLKERLTKEAYEKAAELKDSREFSFLTNYADVTGRLGNYEKSIELLLKAKEFGKDKNDYCWIIYAINAHRYSLGKYKKSFKFNLENARECLFLDRGDYLMFFKTNSWIANSFNRVDLSKKYALSNNFTKQIRSNNFKALIDLIRVLVKQRSYEKVLAYADMLLAKYRYDKDFNKEDKVGLMLIKAQSLLFCKKMDGFVKESSYIESNFNLLSMGNKDYDRLLVLKIFYSIYKKKYSDALNFANEIIDTKKRESCMAIAKSYIDIDNNSIEVIANLENLILNEDDIGFKHELKLFLARAYAVNRDDKEAIACVKEIENFYKGFINPMHENIIEEIKNTIGEERFYLLKEQVSAKEIDESFFLDNLPKQITTKDGKKMVLIPEGFSIYGVDHFEIPTIDEIFKNPEMILNNKRELLNIYYLGNFYIDEYPVTVGEYKRYCEEVGKNVTSFKESDNKPIKNITIAEMQEYAKYYGKELALPQEWEKAYRGEKNYNYPWGNEWDENINIKIDDEAFNYLKILLVSEKDFQEYHSWLENYEPNDKIDLGVLEDIKFLDDVDVDKFFFFKILFHSLSLNTLEKLRVINAIPTLSQFQVDEVLKVFTEEANKFVELGKEHPSDIIKLFKKMKNESLDIIGELTLKNNNEYIKSISQYGVKDMVGNGYEVTLQENRVVYKGSMFAYDYKEKFKGKNYWAEDMRDEEGRKRVMNNQVLQATFRLVKPIFSADNVIN